MLASTMLTIIGFLMVVVIVYCLMQSKTTPVPVFAILPIVAILLFNLLAATGVLSEIKGVADLVNGVKGLPKAYMFVANQVTFTLDQIAGFIKLGVGTTWTVAVLFIFSITFFGVLTDAGMFEPMVDFLVRKAATNVVLVTLATGVIATIAHLDGSLAVTLLITVPAMLPIYKRLNMRPITILIIIGAAMSIMNLLPWGGPVARIATILKYDINKLWAELIPLQIAGVVVVLLFSAFLGLLEKRRGAGLVAGSEEATAMVADARSSQAPWGVTQFINLVLFLAMAAVLVAIAIPAVRTAWLGTEFSSDDLLVAAGSIILSIAAFGFVFNYILHLMSDRTALAAARAKVEDKKKALMRPELLVVNVYITVLTLGLLAFFPAFPAYYSFMAGLSIALVVNYPDVKQQGARIKAHAGDAVSMAAILLASGVFLGVLANTGMIKGMAVAIVHIIPDSIGPYMHLVLGVFSIPIGMVLGTDSFFFGFVPVANEVGQTFGIDPMNMAKALLIGKNYGVIVTPHAATTFLAIGLAGVELKEHLKVVTLWMWPLGVLSLVIAIMLGIVTV